MKSIPGRKLMACTLLAFAAGAAVFGGSALARPIYDDTPHCPDYYLPVVCVSGERAGWFTNMCWAMVGGFDPSNCTVDDGAEEM